MPPESKTRCRVCGTPLSGETADVGCTYCLLQLGLAPAAAKSSVSGRISKSNGHGDATIAGEHFVRQGVLPRFGDYELESEIARGGMGVVYRARQRSLNRTVAVKMILAGQLASPESVQRFRLEAEAAAQLHHPGIVPIYEIGEYETQHFFSMELIEGVSLAECIDDFRLLESSDPKARREQQNCIADLIAAVARALEFAHQRGVLHRDLKPSNILIDEQGRPRLTDFGLAKLTGRESSGLTLSAAVLGTPGYLAPEQAAGRTEVTTAADVYGLGATLYELLTRHPPFEGTTAIETMWMAVERNPTPPRQRNPAVHRDLETIALRCLEKEPERRYPSAAAVADELDRFLRREPILARPVGPIEQAWRWCQRNTWQAALVGALLVTILMGSGIAFWQWGRAESANATLVENVSHLEYGAIDTMLNEGQSSRALARLAALLRKNPDDWKAAMLAMSVMEQRRFPLPAAPMIRHPDGAELSVARLSPNGRTVVTASFDKTARLWNAVTSEPVGEPMRHEDQVTWAEFSPDGGVIATSSKDKAVRLWDAESGRPLGKPVPHDESVEQVRFNHDGSRLLTRTPQTVSILNGTDGRVLIGPLRLPGTIAAARFIVDKDAFFTARVDGDQSRLSVWDLASGKESAGMNVEPFRTADVNDDLTQVAVIHEMNGGRVYDFPSGKNRKDLVGSVGQLDQIAFGAKSHFLAVVGRNQWARVWDARTAQPITAELPHYYLIRGVSFLNDGRRLLTWADDALAQIWDLSTAKPFCEPMRHPNRVIHAEIGTGATGELCLTTLSHLKSRSVDTKTGAAHLWRIHDGRNPRDRTFGEGDLRGHDGSRISNDGRLLAYASTRGEVHVHDCETGAAICPPLPIVGGAWGLIFSPDARRLIVTTSRGQVSVWSIPEGKLVSPPVILPTTIQPAELSPDGEQFATGSTDHFVRLWDAATGRILREMRHGSEINALAYSPDGRLVASAGEDRVVRLWNTADGSQLREFVGHQNEVMSVRFSKDGKRLLTASLDFTGRIWDTGSGQSLATLPHQGEVLDVAVASTGRYIATASRDRTAMIWDAETGLPHSRGLLHEQGVRNVFFSADGRRLFTIDFRGIRMWDVETSHPLTVHLDQTFIGGTGFQSASMRSSVSADAQTAFVATDSMEARLWHFTTPSPGAPSWFPEFLEAVAGQRFTADADRPELVPPESFLKLQAQLSNSTAPDDYTRWARRWLFESTK